ncbi:hypothetical protein PILCRDRAFT_99389 [Piloderma croceum F 1598]|uniref:Uncharacterized protein n=1 Tax=Piloderma croceum (strain F 1598) TaxID=765440 RepID=A0A0C3B521_PILCF|nr:hypothetical protein PILCRDRAFT_99389 [Piloderma croceum F 1598]
MRLIPLREITMMLLMNQLTEKEEWDRKICDDEIVAKWKSEVLPPERKNQAEANDQAAGDSDDEGDDRPDNKGTKRGSEHDGNDEGIQASGLSPEDADDRNDERIDITENMFNWCIAELRHKLKSFQRTGAISVFDGDVVKSDTAIPSALKDALNNAVAKLEDVLDMHRDWHPGSNEQVLDLVHPSLFPVVYGRTRVLPDSLVGLDDCITSCGKGLTLDVPLKEECALWVQRKYENKSPHTGHLLQNPFSQKFQWLPCEVAFSENDEVKITSYINNLHPQHHKDLYGVIEKILAKVIPLWNMTLTPLQKDFTILPRIVYEECVYDPDPEDIPDEEKPQQEDGEDEDDYYERLEQWENSIRKLVLPEPDEFKPRFAPESVLDMRKEFGQRGLQVIVKLANIYLTGKKPIYNGGTWHVEGQLNEHICASAIYYYSSSNITESRLLFRQLSDNSASVSYGQDRHDWLEAVFGCQNDESSIQYIGGVTTKEGRVVTFPNVFQHQVQPFELEDRTKPGHRKILALFLVDPHIRIISSANVPAQRKDWWAEEIRLSGIFPQLPAEIHQEVMDHVDGFPISLEEAKTLRLELMDERKAFVARHDKKFAEATFSLCEH